MQFYEDNQIIYKVTRETKAYYFMKQLNKVEIKFNTGGITFLNMGETITFIKYLNTDVNEATSEHKVLKKYIKQDNKFNSESINNEINNVYFKNGYKVLNYNESNFKNNKASLKFIYNLIELIYSINTDYILKLKKTDSQTNEIYNNLLKELKRILTPDKFNYYLNMIKKEVEEPVFNGLLNIIHSVLNIVEPEEEEEEEEEAEAEAEETETEEEAEAKKKQYIINELTTIYNEHINIIIDDKPTYNRLFDKYLKRVDTFKKKNLEHIQDFILVFDNLSDDME